MRILVLSFYFEPDLCAGSFRNAALVKALSEILSNDDKIEVITTFPNRYRSYRKDALDFEKRGIVSIRRVKLPLHHGRLLDQARAFFSYVKEVLKSTKKNRYDIVFASTSRLMTGVLGALVARRHSAAFYLDIRDIFIENIDELYKKSHIRIFFPVFRYLEYVSVRGADRVSLTSPAFLEYFYKIDDTKSYRIFTNGIDSAVNNSTFVKTCDVGIREILYAGNIGAGQGLHKIIPELAVKLGKQWRIKVVGDGGMRSELESAVSGIENVVVENPVDRRQLYKYYHMADVLFLHLNDLNSFKKVLPSKVFEYAASGKPILAGVDGYICSFLTDHVENVAIFSPCDAGGAVSALGYLRLEDTPRTIFCESFQRAKITNIMAKDIVTLAE